MVGDAMRVESQVEQHEADRTRHEWTVDVDPSTVKSFLESLQGAWSATLRIPGNGQEMAVSLNEGRVAILLSVGDDEFYDLIAGEPLDGWTEFVHGGQMAEHSRRHCVSVSEAVACAAEFLKSRAVPLPNARWEHQEEHQRA